MKFISLAANSCIFIRNSSNDITIIALYVDDILIKTKYQTIIDEIKRQIYKQFKCTEIELVNQILNF